MAIDYTLLQPEIASVNNDHPSQPAWSIDQNFGYHCLIRTRLDHHWDQFKQNCHQNSWLVVAGFRGVGKTTLPCQLLQPAFAALESDQIQPVYLSLH